MTPGRADGLWRGGDKFQNSFKIYFYYFSLMDGKKKSVWQQAPSSALLYDVCPSPSLMCFVGSAGGGGVPKPRVEPPSVLALGRAEVPV